MRRGMAAACAVAALPTACGGGTDRSSPGDVARAWVAAVNARDWKRVCDLSVRPESVPCVRVVPALLGGLRGVTLRDVDVKGEAGAFAIAAEQGEVPSELALQLDGGEWLVHFEAQVIR